MTEEKRREEPGAAPPTWTAVSRGLALFLGGFTLLNLAGDLVARGFDANLWWIDLGTAPHPSWVRSGRLPPPAVAAILAGAAVLLVAFGARPLAGRLRLIATAAACGTLLLGALENVALFYRIVAGGSVRLGIPVPLSLLVALALLSILAGVLKCSRSNRPPPRCHRILTAATVGAALVAFPLLQMVLFGKTDYRRPADAAVVFGARAYADGRPSTALADRVRTACELYSEGLAGKLVFSGGPGDGPVHETEAMRRLAVSLGVPEADIILDPEGLSTGATVRNTTALFEREGWTRILAVSHFYHLPRVKMTYGRAGREVFTVPAKESRVLRRFPYLIAREVVAIWAYYAGGVLRDSAGGED
jgi:uncharacterized SAM-binding protein YcdF (DUF218 family)